MLLALSSLKGPLLVAPHQETPDTEAARFPLRSQGNALFR